MGLVDEVKGTRVFRLQVRGWRGEGLLLGLSKNELMYKLPLEGNKVKALLIVYLGVRRVAELELREKEKEKETIQRRQREG